MSSDMTMDERIARINELARKSRESELTPEEKEEQAVLRREYIDSFKRNLGAQLESIKIKHPDGTIEQVRKRK